MALIGSTTTIPPNGGTIIANNVDLTKVIANGVVVWEKQTEIILINNGILQNSDYIISCNRRNVDEHDGTNNTTSINKGSSVTNSITGTYMDEETGEGCYDSSGYWCCEDCSCLCKADIELKIDSSLIGKQCTLSGNFNYGARWLGPKGYIKNGTTSIWSHENEFLIDVSYPQTISKTFTLTSDVITFHIEFYNGNNKWAPTGTISLTKIVIE